MALYDALEYLSCGPVGLFLLLLFFNALNVAFMWNEHYAVISLIVVTPVALASNALNSVQRNAALRVRMERANAEHLRAPDGDPFEDYHVADEEASDEEAPGEDECPRDGTPPPDILDDFTAVKIFVADLLRGLRALCQRPDRRRRRTPGRGDCPAPGNAGAVPDGRPL
ncbi:hypothetical protein F443_22437 [Phytophthora nicotianae P1569]|uniref:Uncharacterized protein n=1 Tax=Phytophthora nicotianae P1569 TaxID=1317065 RepID=V9DUA9_PHYNI|nr:hypothetical protein F443_22437 [Phytophthora nicotianae P1569]